MENRAAWLLLLFLIGAIGISLVGCATGPTTTAQGKTMPQMLTAAGFRAYPAATAGQIRHLKTCPPETMMIQERKGTAGCYAFADEKTQTMYIGDEAAYWRFKKALGQQGQRIMERKVQDDPDFWLNWGSSSGGG